MHEINVFRTVSCFENQSKVAVTTTFVKGNIYAFGGFYRYFHIHIIYLQSMRWDDSREKKP